VANVLIGLLSCQSMTDRRELCRRTWLPEVRKLGFDVVFLIGGHPEVKRVGDELNLPVDDGYRQLPQKTIAFCKWAIEQPGVTHIFKADDDTLIHPQRFKDFADSLTEDSHYIGNEWSPRTKYASGGAGYILSRPMFELVATKFKRLRGYEDRDVGNFLRSHGHVLQIDHRFIAFGNETRRPLPDNDYITTHKIPLALWEDTWSMIAVPHSCESTR